MHLVTTFFFPGSTSESRVLLLKFRDFSPLCDGEHVAYFSRWQQVDVFRLKLQDGVLHVFQDYYGASFFPSRPLPCGKQAILSGETWVNIRGDGLQQLKSNLPSSLTPVQLTLCADDNGSGCLAATWILSCCITALFTVNHVISHEGFLPVSLPTYPYHFSVS